MATPKIESWFKLAAEIREAHDGCFMEDDCTFVQEYMHSYVMHWTGIDSKPNEAGD